MTSTSHRRVARGVTRATLAAGLSVGLIAAGAMPAFAAQADPPLGTSTSFAVLAASTVTNTGPSLISGNVGLSPGTSITGFPPAVVTGGVLQAATASAATAEADAHTAYDAASTAPASAAVTADLGGQTLAPGVYDGASLALTGQLTLNGQGNPDGVFILQAGSTLTTASASSVLLTNGASACHVYWQVGSSATLGAGSSLSGSVLAHDSITAGTAAAVTGRLLALDGAVTLDSNTITDPTCTTPSGPPAPVTTPPVVSPPVVSPPVVSPPTTTGTGGPVPPATMGGSPDTSPAQDSGAPLSVGTVVAAVVASVGGGAGPPATVVTTPGLPRSTTASAGVRPTAVVAALHGVTSIGRASAAATLVAAPGRMAPVASRTSPADGVPAADVIRAPGEVSDDTRPRTATYGTASAASVASGVGQNAVRQGQALAYTGAGLSGLVATGLLLLALGGALMTRFGARRHSPARATRGVRGPRGNVSGAVHG